MAEISVSLAAVARLVDHAFPAPDDVGPWGPIGPVIRRRSAVLEALEWILLNPQPLPPKEGPQPEPWRAAAVGRTLVAKAISLRETGGEAGAIQSQVRDLVDDWCGTPPRPRPFPWPWGPLVRAGEELHPVDLVVAGAQLQNAVAHLEGDLAETFADAGAKLMETGLSRLG